MKVGLACATGIGAATAGVVVVAVEATGIGAATAGVVVVAVEATGIGAVSTGVVVVAIEATGIGVGAGDATPQAARSTDTAAKAAVTRKKRSIAISPPLHQLITEKVSSDIDGLLCATSLNT